jgi:hypothetical protein
VIRRRGFENEDDDEYENEVPHENARKRSWKRWAASAAVRSERGGKR